MKFKSFNRVLAALLMLTMLAGQVLMSTAMALNEEPGIVILDESDLLEAEPTPTPTPGPQEEWQEDGAVHEGIDKAESTPEVINEEYIISEQTPAPASSAGIAALPEGADEPAKTSEVASEGEEDGIILLGDEPLADGDGGLSVLVTSSQTTVQDGEEYKFTVVVRDDDLTTLPNIIEGETLTIELPEFLEIRDFPNVLRQYFEWPPYYDQESHSVTLTFKEIAEGMQNLNMSFTLTAIVNTIGYDGDGKDEIKVGLGNVETATASTEVGVDTGTGETEEKPYLKKNIWSNVKQMGTDFVMNDPEKPIGYSAGFGVKCDYNSNVTFRDDLSGGHLALCSVTGDTNAPLGSCITKVTIGGKVVTPADPTGETLVFNDQRLGVITISRDGTGFKAVVTRETAAENTELVNVQLRYFAVVVGDANSVTNAVSLSIDGKSEFHDEKTILRYETHGAVVSKKVLYNGEEVTAVDLTEEDTVDFRIKINQYGEGSVYKDGENITWDDLKPCFEFVGSEPITGPFKIEANGQRLNIVKVGNDAIPAGEYNIDFTVKIDKNLLKYGEESMNTVGNTVVIRRKAKLTIDKTWDGDNAIAIGEGAVFVLLDGDKVIASAESKENDTVTLYIKADDLRSGQHTYILKETVDEKSGYSSVRDKEVVITKADNDIIINSIDGWDYNSGEARVSITNTPDSGLGTVSFRKLGEGDEPLQGGTFQLWKENEGSDDEWIADFSTVNGSWSKEGLEYGTYYVKEISAPPGYILTSQPSEKVTIKKTDTHETITMTNEKYTVGSITIKKEDEDGNPLAGAEFTLLPVGVKKTTGENGEAIFDGLTEGTYTITETEAPTGYGKLEGYVTVNIEANGTANVAGAVPDNLNFNGKSVILTWKNTRTQGSISITKTGSEGKPLQGAVFGLYNDAAAAEKPIDIQQTDKNGKALFADLAAGTYYVKEITAPNGYALSDEVHTFIIGNGENAAWDCGKTITNQLKKYTLKLTKKGDDGKLLAGVEFAISGTGVDPMTAESGKEGVVTFTGLAFGEYTITEVEAPQGYVKAAPIKVTIDGSD
ncbi:MAG: SpaA isopeptide-forming pilin-related protein, partial [Eubacteriales bacterium]|nr:SpaA isopeptide-forming pilin-related protein [Eubacteriales bacterium]